MMNALVGENLSIITSKAQTTRHRILGIVNNENYQIVFSDLPGILKPHYKLQEKMLHFIEVAIQDADVFLYMVEAGETKVDEEIAQKIIQSKKPVVVLINKIDLSTQEEIMVQIQHWSEIFSGSQVIPISALNNFNIEKVKDVILDMLPENPPYFPKDELTDKHMRFFVAEIIREKILLNFKQEVPYSVEVVVDQYKEEENLTRIFAYIYVARESQKMIILGKQGRAIKKLGTDARLDIEKFIDQKVFLELTVKVLKDWRDNDKQLKRLGYEN